MNLAALRLHFERATQRMVTNPPAFGKPELMRQARLEMQVRGGTVDSLNDDRIAQALDILRQDGPKAALASHCRWICWGLTKPMPGGTLLASKHLFPATLLAISEIHAANALSAGAWRGLVDAYFTPNAALRAQAAENWLALRDFLAASLPAILSRARARPDWLEQLETYPGLLGDAPGAPFAADVLAGQQEKLDALRGALTIGPESWFWEQLILAQVQHATTLPDAPFHQVLDNLLTVAAKYPGIINETLVALLSRYHRCREHDAHERLKSIAVEKWGSPNLVTQATWNKVTPAVKRMVQEWMVREDLLDFFNILKDNRETDQRRLNFWIRYYKQMDWAKLGFGSKVLNSRDRDTVDLLSKKRGCYCTLTGGGANNAIIMKLGGHFFVEFSQTNNAAYGYADGLQPFNPDRVELAARDLRDENPAFHETHKDTLSKSWEQKFEDRLATFGIFPDSAEAAPAAAGRTASPPPAQRPQAVSLATSAAWERTLAELKARFGLRGEDKRDRGGNLWIWHLRDNDAIAARLAEIGFRFIAGKGWWRK